MEEAAGEARIRARRADSRPAGSAETHPGTADRHRRRRARRRRVRDRGRARANTRSARCWFAAGAISAPPATFPRAALAEPRRSARLFHHAVLLDARSRPPEVFVNRKLEDAEALAQALDDACGAHRSRCSCPVRGLGVRWAELAQENATQGAAHAPVAEAGRRGDARGARRGARAAGDPGAHRVLRHQPHGRGGHRRVLRRVRPGRAAEEGISPLQHHRRHARRRLRRACGRRSRGATRASGMARSRRRTCC